MIVPNWSGTIPVVNGDADSSDTVEVVSGETFTITGAGFGANPLDIEFLGGDDGLLRLADEGVAQDLPSWDVDTPYTPVKSIVDDSVRGKSWGIEYNGTTAPLNGDIRFDYGSNIPENTDIVVGFHAYLNSSLQNDGQWKILRIKSDGGLSDSGTELVAFNHYDATGKQLVLRRGADISGENTSGYGGKYPNNDGDWTYLEFIVNTGSEGVEDGDIKQLRHQEGLLPEVASLSYYFPNNATKIYDSALRYRYFMFQNYLGNGFSPTNNPLYVGISDPFIQVGSTKRVFLTDNAVFLNSTWREYQKPLSWTDTNISCTLNKANRPAGTYYLHVVEGVDTVLATQECII